jgi:RNA polymerase sigma-70 factor, ECF subfamily
MVIADAPPIQSDEPALLARACAGEAGAFCALVEPLQPRLLRQALALTGNEHNAEDLVSETLVEAWKNLPRFNRSCRLSTWLYSILLHRHYKSIRRARRWPISFGWLRSSEADDAYDRQNNLPTSEPSPAESLAQNETAVRLRECLEKLPEKHREVVLLRFFEDASLTEIAHVLRCSLGTVKSRLHHALEKLRQMKMNLPAPDRDKPI